MASTNKKEKTFEESMARLEEIVNALETNTQPLDETITLFSEGLQLVKSCDERLKRFEKQVSDLLEKNGGDTDESL